MQYQAEQFLLVDVNPVIVLGPHNRDRQQDCPIASQVVINNAPERGKTSSIQTGLQALPTEWSSLFISAVDQPRDADVYRRLLQTQQHQSAAIVAPTYQGKMGHPLLFAYSLKSALTGIREETLGLRQVVQSWGDAIARVEFPTSQVLTDLNTPTLYADTVSSNPQAKI